jgi:molybdopterin converting factor subunit 1
VTEMTVTVRLFAFYADRLGRSELSLELPPGSTVASAVRSIASLPGASVIPAKPLVAVNCTYATADTLLAHGDEVALIPPVAGG